MPRPRNTKIKIVLELRETTYQRVAVKAYEQNRSVTEWCQEMLDNALVPSLPLPVAPPVEAPPAPPAAVEPAPEPGTGKRKK